jgi:hypothetical protein
VIDLSSERPRLLAKASPDVPGRPHASTLLRWALRGVKGVKLETVIVGGRRFTSLEAIQRFIERLSKPEASEHARQQRGRRNSQVEQELDEAGIRALEDAPPGPAAADIRIP